MANNNKLRKNQINAIQLSLQNNFQSGVHFHATGTGKSWISLELLLEFNKKNNNSNILWLCEQKSILNEQFDKKIIKEKGYDEIYEKFLLINYSNKKKTDWYSKVNSATFWKKPILLIINRAFLVSNCKYEKLKIQFDLIIHDECHSITNKTTQKFYNYILVKQPNIKCIGFSATPNLNYKPYDKIISKYTIYDAFLDNVIVPPKIKFIKSKQILNDCDFLKICKTQIKNLYYKKIIVWCGIIKKCYELSKLWKENFSNFLVVTDTSKDKDKDKDNNNYKKYFETEKNAILFCACKHREGSDIKNLDCCIFLDKVENRSSKTFVQCIGRVLRKDRENNKKYGLILDFKASSCIKLCDRMNEYLNCKNGFPWKYYFTNKTINEKKILLHTLKLKETQQNLNNVEKKEYTIKDLVNNFVKPLPNKSNYHKRLKIELKLIRKKKLEAYLIRAVNILKITNYIPHVTRGSCGSSLVCFLLGISNVDPVEMNISFSRFLNKYRNNLPDIDFDFPHYLRDEVFLKLELKWPNQVARISNHVYWHDKSALREAIRRIGFRKQIPKEQLLNFVKSLPFEKQIKVQKIKKKLEDTFRYYSLHCGGIIFFHAGVPDNLILNKKILNQIVYNKHDVAKTQNFKIDILSSRGISQLIGICGNSIDFADCKYDEETYKMLQNGDNIGITLAESPLMRKAMMMIKPKSIKDIAICLAIIRPAAKDARIGNNEIDYKTRYIYDDDAIQYIQEILDCDECQADIYRKAFSKNKAHLINEFSLKIKNRPDKIKIIKNLKSLHFYSFCKSHAYSYAQLVWALAYQKANNPKKFWVSTINNCHSKSDNSKNIGSYGGGIVGSNFGKGGATCTITNCTNNINWLCFTYYSRPSIC